MTGPRTQRQPVTGRTEHRPPETCVELSVVIPVYRSAAGLRTLVERLLPVLEKTGLRHEVVFVEDGSPDDSWQVFAQASGRSSHRDRSRAAHAQLWTAQCPDVRVSPRARRLVVTMDDDLQNPPEEIPKLLGGDP